MYLGRCLLRIRPLTVSRFAVHTVSKHVSPRNHSVRSISTGANKGTTAPVDLDAALESRNAVQARAIYAHVKANRTGGRGRTGRVEETASLNHDQLHGILRVLARSAKKPDLALIHTILADMSSLFEVDVSSHTHSAILNGFVDADDAWAALRWLVKMQDYPGNISPTLPQWHTWIQNFIPRFEQRQIVRVLRDMEATGCSPTLETYKLLFSAMFRYRPKIDVVKSILQKKSETLPYDPTFPAFLSKGYTNFRLITLAEEAAMAYNSIYGRDEGRFENHCNSQLMQAYCNKDRRRTTSELEKLRSKGFSPSIETLKFLLAESVDVHDLKFWEESLGVTADVHIWASLIRNCVQKAGSVPKALQVYDQFISSGLTPDSKLILPIIRSICMKTLRPPRESDIDRALGIYKDFYRLTSDGEPNAVVYNTLISALASTSDTAKYFPKALSLLEDMKSRKVAMDSMTATSITILLLRSSTSPSEAFQAYKRVFKRPDGKPALDAEGYVAVLNVFCRLTFGKTNIHTALPPWEQYFEIVKDMREAGYPVNVKVYTIILQQLGLAATKFRQARYTSDDDQPDLSQLERAIRKIHQLLTMDPSIQPDTVAWNTLMDAYQRAGCIRDAYRVWDTLWLSRMFDNASVSIIADACGHANALNEALQIFSRLQKVGFPLNTRNWNAWLECLCRLGRLDEAVKTLCLEMGSDGNAAPDENSVRIVLRFASGSREENQIRERIRRYLPEL